MLESTQALYGCSIVGADGPIGEVRDTLIDDEKWAARYLVAETGTGSVPGRAVLIPTSVLREPESRTRSFSASIPTELAVTSPHIDGHREPPRELEVALHRHYECRPYWSTEATGALPGQPEVEGPNGGELDPPSGQAPRDTRLFRAGALIGHAVHAEGEGVGRVTDIVVHVGEWVVQHVVASIGTWPLDVNLMVPPDWIERVDPADLLIHVDLPREPIMDLPRIHADLSAHVVPRGR